MDLDRLPWIQVEDSQAAYLAKPYLPQKPVILEAGVCDAEDTIRFKTIWPEATIYGFEPVPSLFEISKANTAGMKGVHIENLALDDMVGSANFFVSSSMPGASSMLEDNLKEIVPPPAIAEAFDADGRTYNDMKAAVKTTDVDSWCDFHGVKRIDYLWLDTEGSEMRIFHGMNRMLKTVRAIQVELNFQQFRKGMPMFEEVYSYITKKGFELVHIWQAHANWQGNGLFVRGDIL